MLQAVIFDMDGVIIDSEPFHLEVNRGIYRELGIEFSEKVYENYVGVTNEEMWADIKKNHSLPHSVSELMEMQISRDMEHIKKGREKPIPGVVELLEEICRNGIPAALASSSSERLIELIISSFNIKDKFAAIVSGANMEKGKPAPDIFLHTASLLNLPPENCVVIEDSRNGVMAAKAAGMKCVGFRNPNSGNQDIDDADHVVEKLSELNLDALRNLFQNN